MNFLFYSIFSVSFESFLGCFYFSDTPPPGYMSEDGDNENQAMGKSYFNL